MSIILHTSLQSTILEHLFRTIKNALITIGCFRAVGHLAKRARALYY